MCIKPARTILSYEHDRTLLTDCRGETLILLEKETEVLIRDIKDDTWLYQYEIHFTIAEFIRLTFNGEIPSTIHSVFIE